VRCGLTPPLKQKDKSMRNLSTILISMFMLIGFAGSASALSIAPSVPFEGYRTQGSIDYSITGTTLTMQVHVDRGKVGRARIAVTSAGGENRGVVEAGSLGGPDVNIARIRVSSDGAVNFYFRQSFFRWHISAGKQSDPFFIQYDTLAAGDVVTFTGYRHWIFGSFASTQTGIVPEPSTAVLVGLGMLGLAVVGRKR
jgi:hypothetical protein